MKREPRDVGFSSDGKWFKGNCHIHTTASDGALDCEGIKNLYSGFGYDFVVITDHAVVSNVNSLSTEDFLFIDGVEFGGSHGRSSFHTVTIHAKEPVPDDLSYEEEIEEYKRQGALILLAHPYWGLNCTEDIIDLGGFDGVEVYNHLAHGIQGRGYAVTYWDLILNRGQLLWAFAVDDAHLGDVYPWPDGGWVWVKAEKLDADAIVESLRAGRFYASNGPQIYDVTIEGGVLRVKTSPCRTVCFGANAGGSFCRRSDGGRPGDAVGPFEEAEFDVSAYLSGENGGYLRVECEDEEGRRAWLNPIFF